MCVQSLKEPLVMKSGRVNTVDERRTRSGRARYILCSDQSLSVWQLKVASSNIHRVSYRIVASSHGKYRQMAKGGKQLHPE